DAIAENAANIAAASSQAALSRSALAVTIGKKTKTFLIHWCGRSALMRLRTRDVLPSMLCSTVVIRATLSAILLGAFTITALPARLQMWRSGQLLPMYVNVPSPKRATRASALDRK